jgi:hypothetical protein
MQATDDDSGYDQWIAEAAQPSPGKPWLALIIGVLAVLFIAAVMGGPVEATDQAEIIVDLLANATTPALVVWLACFLISFRHARIWWSIGGAVLFLAVSGIITLASVGVHQAVSEEGFRADGLRADQNIDQWVRNTPEGQVPADYPTDRGGPVERFRAAFANDHFQEMRRFDEAARATGVRTMLGDGRITHNSAFLGACSQMAALEQTARANQGGVARHGAAARAVGERLVASGELTQRHFNELTDGLNRHDQTTHDRIWAIQADIMRHAAAGCRTLARRRWEMGANRDVLFTSDADLAAFNGDLTRLQTLNNELNAIIRAERARSLPQQPPRPEVMVPVPSR